MDNMKFFREYIKELRLENNLTQVQLSKEIKIAQSTIVRLENGVNIPDVLTLISYALFFKVSTDKLLGLEGAF